VRSAVLWICPSDDAELLAVEALRLHPKPAVAGRVDERKDGGLEYSSSNARFI